jgi:hypothetical protein
LIADEKLLGGSTNEKQQNHYVLQAPLPLPRRLLTPISASASQEEVTLIQSIAPCPAPRTRKPTSTHMELDVDVLPSQIILSPSPLLRQSSLTTPTVNGVYSDVILRTNDLVESSNGLSTSSQPHTIVGQPNPWNRYNHQRYSDDEPEPTFVYRSTIVRQ